MAVKKKDEEYRCNTCGNLVVVIKAGGGTLACCNKEMVKTEPGEYTWKDTDLPDADGG